MYVDLATYPLSVAPEAARRPPADGGIPACPGFYAWWLVRGSLPGVPSHPHPRDDAALDLLYVGIAPNTVACGAAMCMSAPGDLMSSEFNPDGTLDVVWTRNTDPTTCGLVTVRDIYFARSH